MALIKKYKKNLKITALVWLACSVIFGLIYFLVVAPQSRARRDTKRNLTKSTREYEFAQKAAREETKARLYGEIESLRSKLNNYVLDYQSADDLTFDISRIAGECKVYSFDIKSYDKQVITSSIDPNNIQVKNFEVSFSAGFREFAVFLNTLERHTPVLFIEKIELSRPNSDSAVYEVTLDVAALLGKWHKAQEKGQAVQRVVGIKL